MWYGNKKRRLGVGVLWFWLAGAAPLLAGNPVMVAVDASGQIAWTNLTDGHARYRVEWASRLGRTWIPLNSAGGAEFRGLEAFTNTGFSEQVPMFFRVAVITNLPPTNMVMIPGGTFAMGDSFAEGISIERPVHDVQLDAFWMGRTEVTYDEWDAVYRWGTNHSYSFNYPGAGKGSHHPVHSVNWYDAVKWCNAKSEMENRTPCYYIANLSTVYRSGEVDIASDQVLWTGHGYRLPTEAEWEHAARGGVTGKRFPWGNTISWSQANYTSEWSGGVRWFWYDLAPTNDCHPSYKTGAEPYTAPVGQFFANAFGLYDMAGNVSEWCWDWYDSNYYSTSPASNPKGPDTIGAFHIVRGGSWSSSADHGRLARRYYAQLQLPYSGVGFRYVIGQP